MPRQVTIRKDATGDAVAAELLSLLESITADGAISDEEIFHLQSWVEANENHELPAIHLLREMLGRILQDGKVTTDERRALHQAIERILPAELREHSKSARIATELLAREKAKQEVTERKEHLRDERERNRPELSVNFMVMGIAYEGRDGVVRSHMKTGDPVFLIREPQNQFDPNAIAVRIQFGQIGYVPREYAAFMAPLLDIRRKQVAYCTKILEGRRFPIPVIQVALYRPDSEIKGALSVEEIVSAGALDAPKHDAATSPQRTGCGRTVLVSVLICLAALIFALIAASRSL